MVSLCETNCCYECKRAEICGGCINTDGHPFGGTCIAAECIRHGGKEAFQKLKNTLISEFHALCIENLELSDLHLLNGDFINLEYPLPNGEMVKLLNDKNVYLGNQIERTDSDRCYGVVADKDFLLVCEYGCNGKDPEIILYKKRVNGVRPR